MSVATRSPLRVVGGCLNSGFANTGEQKYTLGGEVTASIWSGMVSGMSLAAAPGAVCGVNTAGGADALLQSGAGRFKDVLVHQFLASGQQVTFYDGATPTSGGPFVASGHRIVGILSPQGAGVSGAGQTAGQVLAFDIPFLSGLCFNAKSGAAGFTATWSPETLPINN